MSKVISFSISDRYLDKLRSLYPALTDNLAVKQFVTDGLDSNLGNSLDDGLDDGLDASVGLPPVTDEIEDSGTKNTLSRYFDRFPNRNR